MLEYLDDSVRSSDDVSRVLGLPTLATIPILKNARVRRLVSDGVTSLQLRNGMGMEMEWQRECNGKGDGNGHAKVNPALLLDSIIIHL